MWESALDVFNEMLKDKGRNVLYYNGTLEHDVFIELEFSDIEQYFKRGEKKSCIPQECGSYFGDTNNKDRVKHVFSVYLLGIYCYNNISSIKNGFNDFIRKIWEKTKYVPRNEIIDLRRDFLYLWYLTALFHDMGYPYEDAGVDEKINLEFAGIIQQKSMMAKGHFDCRTEVFGIPAKIEFAAADYFYHRINNPCFVERRRVDHGFCGGYILYKQLQKLHKELGGEGGSEAHAPLDSNGLLFSDKIFKWYNIPSAWAIVCHNIWLAESGSGRDEKYKYFKLDELTFKPKSSPINHKAHPLLFLLDFLDTLDPVKRFGESVLDCIFFSTSNGNADVLTMKICCSQNCKTSCAMSSECMGKICKDLSFLKSEFFDVKTNDDGSIVFSFCSAIKIDP